MIEATTPVTLAHYIDILPNEVLANILEQVGLAYPAHADVQYDLARVCRRFRQIVLHLPRLWTRVWTTSPNRRILNNLERSREMGLDVRLYPVPLPVAGIESSTARVNSLLSHAHRWQELCLSVEHRYTPVVIPIWVPMPMPRLRMLKIKRDQFVEPVEDRNSFTSDWHMPNLHTLKLFNMLPYHRSNGSLRYFSFKIVAGQRESEFFSRAACEHLREFLTSSPQLETLKLDFSSTATGDMSRLIVKRLPAVRVLHIRVNFIGYLGHLDENRIVTPFVDIVNSLSTPALEKVVIRLAGLDTDDIKVLLDGLLPVW